jgi:ubiquinone/menaquinone biosynthesis C-methylase UbiE
MARRADFDSLARIYSTLEWLAFGRGLERARFCLLEHLRDCPSILLLGDGDGRCLAQLTKIAPTARLHSVDASPAMLARAKSRLNESERARVTFTCADAQTWNPPIANYDAVVTLFFLDCFSEAGVKALVDRIQPALRPGARWLWADFVLPTRGMARWRAQVWLWVMYLFFRWQTGLATRVLPPSEEILYAAGWRPLAARDFHGIFVRSLVFNQPGCRS